VKGLCGDGSSQGDRIGHCLEDTSTTTSTWLLDEHILVVSEDTSTITITTTNLPIPAHASNKGKIIAGAVAGSVGGVALLGGLLGGLLHTTVTTPSPTTTELLTSIVLLPTTTTTAPPTAMNVTFEVSHTRFLQGHGPAANSMHDTVAHYLGSPWVVALAFGALSAAAVIAVGFQSKGRRQAPRDFPGATEIAESSGESSGDEQMRPRARSGPDAFDLADKNHDGVISREEFNAAFVPAPCGAFRVPQRLVAPSVYVLPASPQRVVSQYVFP
jgi:hypothetical protein